MRVALTDEDRRWPVDRAGEWGSGHRPWSEDLAWLAFGRAVGADVELPPLAVDGAPVFYDCYGESFRFVEVEGRSFLPLCDCGSWVGVVTLFSECCYVSFRVGPGAAFIEFYGWYRAPTRFLPVSSDPEAKTFLNKDELNAMELLLEPMKRIVAGETAERI